MLGGMRHTLLALTLTLLAPTLAFAQGGGTAIAITITPVYVAPDASRTPLRTAAQGTVFTVLAEQGEWTQVQFKDPQWGIRVGYVATKALQFRRPELEPMDLSTTAAVPRTLATTEPPARPRSQQSAPRPWEVPARSFERVWIDVNLGAAIAADKTVTLEHSDRLFDETRTFRTVYENPTGASFDFGGGVMFTPQIGVGVSFAGTAHQAAPEMFVQVPHPNFFNAAASDTADADEEFQRVEGSVHLQVMGAAPLGENVRLRVFGGPTYFRLQHDLVSSIRYLQTFAIFSRANAVDITTYDSVDKVEGTGWGYHVGSDISFFFTRVVGLGAFARYSHGTVDLVEPALDSEVELKVGGLQFGGGLRLKF
jgi:hypothetical protein